MANKKADDTKANTEVEVIKNDVDNTAPEKVKEPTLKDGIYTEYGVELHNGAKIPVSVYTRRKDLPLSVYTALESGNSVAVIMGRMTARTRQLLDYVGADGNDLKTLGEVLDRAGDMREDGDDS